MIVHVNYVHYAHIDLQNGIVQLARSPAEICTNSWPIGALPAIETTQHSNDR
jgi:hypothetical protein